MDCLSISINHFFQYHKIKLSVNNFKKYLQNYNYTIYTRLESYHNITVKKINSLEDIEPHSLIGIYLKRHEYLNVNGFHFFYVDNMNIISSWNSSRSITKEEYDLLPNKTRSLSETSIDDGMINEINKDILVNLWELINNDKDDIGNDIYNLFGGTNETKMEIKKSEYKIILYMYNIS